MKLLALLTLAVVASAAVIEPRHHRGRGGGNNNNNNNAAAGNGNNNAATGNGNNNAGAGNGNNNNNNAVATGNTVVLFEVGGVPGNECLTFRNNGEIVDAACVNEAADRQMTPTTINGASVLRVQRSFTAGFRPDLAGVADVCVGFNGTHFRAEDCAASGIEFVNFAGGELKATSGACASGHDNAAQMTVDTSGNTCAQFTSTTVTPTAP